MDMQNLKWSEIVVSALLIFFIALLLTFVVSGGYSFVVGFQTRGDMEMMTERVIAFTSSFGFRAAMIVLPGVLALWRSQKIVANAPDAPVLNALAVGVCWLIIRILAGVVMPPFDLPRILIELVLVMGALYLGVQWRLKQTAGRA